jgi:hypothetical protein
MGDKLERRLAIAGKDVKKSRRQTSLCADLGDRERGSSSGRMRLDYDGVACRNRRRHLLDQQIDRSVERRYRSNDAKAPASCEPEAAGTGGDGIEWNRLTAHRLDLPCACLGELRRALHFESCKPARFADVVDYELSEARRILLDRRRRVAQPPSSLGDGGHMMAPIGFMGIVNHVSDDIGGRVRQIRIHLEVNRRSQRNARARIRRGAAANEAMQSNWHGPISRLMSPVKCFPRQTTRRGAR